MVIKDHLDLPGRRVSKAPLDRSALVVRKVSLARLGHPVRRARKVSRVCPGASSS